MYQFRLIAYLFVALSLFAAASAVAQGADPPPQESETSDSKDDDGRRSQDPRDRVINELLDEMHTLKQELQALRAEVAAAKLEADAARRELQELQQFIRDNREFGDDFDQYREIKEIREREAKQRAAAEARERREQQRSDRLAQRNAAMTRAQIERAEKERIEQYREAGFNPLGLDVFIGRTGFFYHMNRTVRAHVEYEPLIGDFLEPIETAHIDYSEMTISGTILNASDQTRNIGVAIAFFDERGNQVGAETVQVANARPNVPYPFTSNLEMALDRPFASSTSWVLYADPVEVTRPDQVDY